MNFTEEQIQRYSRHIILSELGGRGQKKLLQSKVLLVGAGGLGSPAAMYLAAAGAGHLGIIDYDTVELSNLQRQILHGTPDVGKAKVDSAKESINRLNPDVQVTVYREKLSQHNVKDLLEGYDLIIDGVDNFSARYLLNDACVMTGKPLVEAGILRWDGMLMTILPGVGPCYRCVFPSPPPAGSVPSCQEAGVVGAVAGVMGILQATEAIKYLTGVGENLVGRMLLFNALDTRFREVEISREEKCPVCGKEPTITSLTEYELQCSLYNNANKGK